ncbi:MAG: TonB-dependent receptor domain-containing protein [Salinibacter sp.]
MLPDRARRLLRADQAGLVLGLAALLLGLAARPARAQAAPVLTGTVVEAGTERPLVGADVTLRGLASPSVIRRTATGLDGTFQLANLPRGTYVLRVQLLGYKAHERTLTLELGESRDLTVALSLDVASFDSIVLSPSRRADRALDVPSSVSVLTPEVIRREGASSSVEALRPTVGVNVAQTGVDRRMLSLRGFGAPFSGTPHVRVDGRTAELPLLGANAFGPMPIMPHDLSRIEVVRGPASTLYGPEASGGLVQFFTRDPFREPGSSLSLAGGSKAFVDAQFRQAGVIGGTVGYKFTGQFSRANEWMLDPGDPQDAAELARYRTYAPSATLPEGRPTAGRQLRRDDLYRTFNTNGRFIYRFDDATRLSFRGGFASLTSPLQTGIGTVQANELSYGYTQFHLDAGRFSVSAGLNRNLDIGTAYRLETGETVLSQGTRWTGQAQYDLGFFSSHTRLLFGTDLDVTQPETTTPTLADRLGDDGIGRYGAYLQSTTSLADPLTLTLAGRVDYNDVVEAASYAPRAALVAELGSGHTLRASYSRWASYPGTDPLFAAGRFAVDPSVQTTGQTVEVGYKGSIRDRVRVHLDAYYETRSDVLTPQNRVSLPPLPPDAPGIRYAVADRIEYGGLDASVTATVTEVASVFANVSLVTDDRFDGDTSGPTVALNAPSSSVKGGIDYGLPAGVSVGATAQYVDSFPVRWGPYIGRVDAYTRLDLRAGYRVPAVPGLRIDVSAKNVLGTEHREFVGAPGIGRMVIARLTYELP